MQRVGMIGCHGAANRTKHEITGQQEKEIAKCQQKTRPLGTADIYQVQEGSAFHDRDCLTGPQPFISTDNDRVTILKITKNFNPVACIDSRCHR